MKRKLSLLMVLMMVLTLIPAMPSFAATKNTVSKVVSVTADGDTDLTGLLSPVLSIVDENSHLQAGEKFRVKLGEGATWSTTVYDRIVATNLGVNTPANITALLVSDSILEVTVVAPDDIAIPMSVDFDGAPEGAQKVTIDEFDSGVTGSSYTYANVGSGKVTATVDSKIKISRNSSANNTVSIILDEIATDSFKSGDVFRFRLPKNFTWDNETASLGTASLVSDRELEVTLGGGDITASRQSIILTADVKASRDAEFGDVIVSVTKGNISPSSLLIGEYVDYTPTVKVKEVLNVLSGRHEEGMYVAEVEIKENVAASLLEGRYIEFSLDKDIASLQDGETLQITSESGVDVDIDAGSSDALSSASGNSVDIDTDSDTNDTVASSTRYSANKWDLEVVAGTTGSTKGKFTLEIPFVVSGLHEGDVELTIKGAGIEEQKVVIAKATKPITVEIDKNSSADLKIGVQKQAAPDIIITETSAGALGEFAYSITSTSDYTINWADAKIEVIEGDLELDADDTDINSDNKGLDIVVDNKSTKASKIKISGVQITLDRTVPYGPFNVDFNFGNVRKAGVTWHKDLSNRVDRKAYFNVVTPAPGDQNATTTFTMDSTTYTMIINGQPQTMTMDVAPFIQDNRAMLPIKYVADAIGAKVNYDSMSRVATFTKDATVAALYLDSNVLYVNGTPVTMDTKPVISNGRAMVPVIYVAQAFGFQYGTDLVYDAATRSVTIFPVAK